MSNSESQNTNDLVEGYPAQHLRENTIWANKMTQTFHQYFSNPVNGQRPRIIWIGCSDSRVQESDVLAASRPGTAFVHRNIANQVHDPVRLTDQNVLSVLEYALGNALRTQHIVVVGHNHCGGVIHALKKATGPCPKGDEGEDQDALRQYPDDIVLLRDDNEEQFASAPPSVIDSWLDPLAWHLRAEGIVGCTEQVLTAAVEANVKLQVNNFARGRPLHDFVKRTARGRTVWVHGWVYDFRNGKIKDLNVRQTIQ